MMDTRKSQLSRCTPKTSLRQAAAQTHDIACLNSDPILQELPTSFLVIVQLRAHAQCLLSTKTTLVSSSRTNNATPAARPGLGYTLQVLSTTYIRSGLLLRTQLRDAAALTLARGIQFDVRKSLLWFLTRVHCAALRSASGGLCPALYGSIGNTEAKGKFDYRRHATICWSLSSASNMAARNIRGRCRYWWLLRRMRHMPAEILRSNVPELEVHAKPATFVTERPNGGSQKAVR